MTKELIVATVLGTALTAGGCLYRRQGISERNDKQK